MMLTKRDNALQRSPLNHYQSLKRNFNHESETENNKRLGVWRN